MKKFAVVLLLAVAGLVLSRPSLAAAPVIGIPGYFDKTTSTFVPMMPALTVPLVTPVVRTGTVKVVITLTIEASIGTDQSISCSASISAFDASFTNSATANGLISRTGSTGSLTMPIPYDWTMAATGETASLSVECTEGFTGAINHSITFAGSSFMVPATNGTVTIKNFSASM